MYFFMFLFLCRSILAAPEMIPMDDTDILGKAAPTFDLETLDNKKIKLEDLRGKPVVLSFWASWCSPCRYELPELNTLVSKYPNVQFVAVNVDKSVGPAKKFLHGITLDMPIVMDNSALILGEYGVLSMPTLFLIDSNGTVQYTKIGYSQEKKLVELEDEIKKVK